VVGYYVYRSTVSGASFSRISALATTAASYTDTNVVSDETCYYEVTSIDSAGVESSHSGQVSAVIP
jgi:fibronectin type 3 domain-containing protein